MKNSDMVKEIRSRLNISQEKMAAEIGVSFATVNRWEKGHCEPSKIAINALKQLCANSNINYADFEGNNIMASEEIVTLYHGSKSGIEGDILPNSCEFCDFGKGFYTGTERAQSLTLICNYPDAKLYTLKADLSGLKILNIEAGLDWALLVAYHRGKMESAKGTAIYNRIASMTDGCDMLIGFIANNRIFVVLDRFFKGEITDVALLNSLSALKFGKQYVALTEKACKQIKIVEEKPLTDEDKKQLIVASENNRQDGMEVADEICRKYRREGRFFDEILKAGR